MPSAGFLVILFAATLLVIIPSFVFFVRCCRSGNIGKIISLFNFMLIIFLGWIVFTDPEVHNFESGAVYMFAVWGFIFYLFIVVYACIRWVAWLKKRHVEH